MAIDSQEDGLVAQTVAKWNQTVAWLQEMDLLRSEGAFPHLRKPSVVEDGAVISLINNANTVRHART